MEQLDSGKSKLWGVNEFMEAFYWDGDASKFTGANEVGQAVVWTQVPGKFKHVSTAEEGIVWAIDEENDIWIWEEGKISVEEIVRNQDHKWTEVDRLDKKMQ